MKKATLNADAPIHKLSLLYTYMLIARPRDACVKDQRELAKKLQESAPGLQAEISRLQVQQAELVLKVKTAHDEAAEMAVVRGIAGAPLPGPDPLPAAPAPQPNAATFR